MGDKYRKCKVKQETGGSKLQNKTWNYENDGNDDTRRKTTARNQSDKIKKIPRE